MANISIPARLAADTPQSQPDDAIFYYGIPRGFRRWMVRNTMDTDLIKAITDIITRGGVTEDGCAILVNNEAVRVVYKNNYGFGVKIFNIYMVRYLPCSLLPLLTDCVDVRRHQLGQSRLPRRIHLV
jgi:hypothetical protein